MHSTRSVRQLASIVFAFIFIIFSTAQVDATPRKKNKDKYDYITLTVIQQFSTDMAYTRLKRGSQSVPQENRAQPMINISFEGDEYAKELQQQFFEQYAQQPSLPLALDFLGESRWEVTTTNQILIDKGLLMTTVILRKAK